VYERAASGKLAGARIYDDIEPPLGDLQSGRGPVR
jgi:hypothetical protein